MVGNGFTLQHSVVGGLDGVEVGSTVYINDQFATNAADFVSAITSFLIDNNILEGSLVVTNGPGTGHPAAAVDFKITDNDFVMNTGSDAGYNWGILLNGQEATIPWRLASIVLPVITGNSFAGDYSIVLRALDDDPAKMPTRAYIDAFIADNIDGDYAFASEADGSPQMNASAANRFFIHSTLDAAVADAVSGGTVVFRAADDISYAVNKDGLTFDAQDGSGAVTLILGTANDLELAGTQDITVLGNGNANVINGNDGDNYITGGGGGDTISGGKGSDTIDAGSGIDTVVFSESFEDLTITRVGSTNNYIVTNNRTGDFDAVLNVENFIINGVTVAASAAVTNEAPVAGTVNLGSVVEDVVGGRDITAAELLAAVTDVDTLPAGRSITAVSIASGGGTLTNPSAGVWHYVPAANANGPVVFNYTVTDGATPVSGVANLTVTPVNDAPVATEVTLAAANEDTQRLITTAELLAGVADVDTADGSLFISLSIKTGGGSLVNNLNGTWSYTPALNNDIQATFDYTVFDGTTAVSSTASLDLLPVNDGIGGLADKTVAIEAGSTMAPIGPIDDDNNLTFNVATLVTGGGRFSSAVARCRRLQPI